MALIRDDGRGVRGPVDPAELRVEVLAVFENFGPIMPADPELWLALWQTTERPSRDQVTQALTALVRDGVLRRIVLGAELHLMAASQNDAGPKQRTEPARSPSASPFLVPARHDRRVPEPPRPDPLERGTRESDASPPAAAGTSAPAADAPVASVPAPASELASLEVAIDAERERLVLYRVAIVIEVLVLLILARQVWL